MAQFQAAQRYLRPSAEQMDKGSPVCQACCRVTIFCGLVPEASKYIVPLPEEDSGPEDEGQAVGAPLDQSKAWRKLARLRVRKACFFCPRIKALG